jgi:hypothetical protein
MPSIRLERERMDFIPPKVLIQPSRRFGGLSDCRFIATELTFFLSFHWNPAVRQVFVLRLIAQNQAFSVSMKRNRMVH